MIRHLLAKAPKRIKWPEKVSASVPVKRYIVPEYLERKQINTIRLNESGS